MAQNQVQFPVEDAAVENEADGQPQNAGEEVPADGQAPVEQAQGREAQVPEGELEVNIFLFVVIMLCVGLQKWLR